MTTSTRNLQFSVFPPDGVVYPGHATALAFLVMHHFDCLESATQKKLTYPAALEAAAIPGAGDCVYKALDVLHMAREKGIEEALAFADASWRTCVATGPYASRFAAGQAQTDAIKDAFREKATAWLALAPA